MHLHDVFHDREAEAGAAHLPAARRINPVKALKEPFQMPVLADDIESEKSPGWVSLPNVA